MIVEVKNAGELLAVEIRLSGAMRRDEKCSDLNCSRHEKGSQNRLEIGGLNLDLRNRFKNKRNRKSQNWVKNYNLEFKQ